MGWLLDDIFVEFMFVEVCLSWLSQDLGQDLVQKCSENGLFWAYFGWVGQHEF